jgi:hypothetical protein
MISNRVEGHTPWRTAAVGLWSLVAGTGVALAGEYCRHVGAGDVALLLEFPGMLIVGALMALRHREIAFGGHSVAITAAGAVAWSIPIFVVSLVAGMLLRTRRRVPWGKGRTK